MKNIIRKYRNTTEDHTTNQANIESNKYPRGRRQRCMFSNVCMFFSHCQWFSLIFFCSPMIFKKICLYCDSSYKKELKKPKGGALWSLHFCAVFVDACSTVRCEVLYPDYRRQTEINFGGKDCTVRIAIQTHFPKKHRKIK